MSSGLFFGALVGACFGQTPPQNPKVRDFRPDVTMVIYKHATGADLFEVSLLNPSYRPTEFSKHLESIGQYLGNAPRGLKLFVQDLTPKAAKPSDPKLIFLKASFALDGVLNGDAGIKLQPLVQAFAGGTGAEEVKAMQIIISNVPASATTVQKFESPAVQVIGQAVGRPPMLDYRIWLDSQNPSAIQIPDRADVSLHPVATASKSGINPYLLWGCIVLIAGAVAVLVYNLALRGRYFESDRTRSRSHSVNRVP